MEAMTREGNPFWNFQDLHLQLTELTRLLLDQKDAAEADRQTFADKARAEREEKEQARLRQSEAQKKAAKENQAASAARAKAAKSSWTPLHSLQARIGPQVEA